MTTAQILKQLAEAAEEQELESRRLQSERDRQARWDEEERARQEFWRKHDTLWSSERKIVVKNDVLTIEKPIPVEPVVLSPLWLKWTRAKIPCRMCGSGLLYPDQMYLLDQNWILSESPVSLQCNVCRSWASAALMPSGKWRIEQGINE